MNTKLIAEEVGRVRKAILEELAPFDGIENATPLNKIKEIKEYCEDVLSKDGNPYDSKFQGKFFKDMDEQERNSWGIYFDDLQMFVNELKELVNEN